ncbi:hypothetical protein K2X14_14435 [Acetobacter sp. TBRC 12305]|uniref:Uncharacterized protein n=1 Tax=Acetobacter garciniae TaxID=2817435 RepID=A0A939KR15_9PROT|nr:hypothetical protein [Acetobacter garciniae]MBO1326229.1 hypothetical protein [Acetobacter garciniae]MBX0346033.1 hypothetical protein [Acetobacter garciniae]
MSAASIGIEGALAALDGAANGKALRAWMEQHREALLAHQDGRRIDWRALCDWFASAGLLNGKGQTPTIRCAQLTWYRVGKWLERRHARAASREAEALQREAEREALLATARQEAVERQQGKERERQAVMERMASAERAAAWQRSEKARLEAEAQRAAAMRQARATPIASEVPARQIEPVLSESGVELVTLDLPKIDGVSLAAYTPFDPSLPPVRQGDINPFTGNAWEYGDDLPGYPSKRHYRLEDDWLRDIGRLLLSRHKTTLTMTEDEKSAYRVARARIRNLRL